VKTKKHPHPEDVLRGKGGEIHQTAGPEVTILTTQQGTPVFDDQNSLKVGPRGPTTLEDFHLREKIFHFDHERIPERVVHARGFGAHGYFENYEPLTDITAADLFQRAGEKTAAFVRFSTVAGNKGPPIWRATSVVSRSSFTRSKAIGTS
jgi:catalase